MSPEYSTAYKRETGPQKTYRTTSGYELVFETNEVAFKRTLPLMKENPNTHELIQIGERTGFVDGVVSNLIGVRIPGSITVAAEPVLTYGPNGAAYFLEQPPVVINHQLRRFSRHISLPNFTKTETQFQTLSVIETKMHSVTLGDGLKQPSKEIAEATGVYYVCDPARHIGVTSYSLATILLTMINGNVQHWNMLRQEPFFQT